MSAHPCDIMDPWQSPVAAVRSKQMMRSGSVSSSAEFGIPSVACASAIIAGRTTNASVPLPSLHARVREHTERYRDRNRLFLDAYLAEHPCVDCGEADIVVLEFDHVRGTKKRALSVLVKHASSLDVLRAEIAKCDVRCANCHRRQTARFHHRRRARLRSAAAGPDLSVVRIDLDDRSQNG